MAAPIEITGRSLPDSGRVLTREALDGPPRPQAAAIG